MKLDFKNDSTMIFNEMGRLLGLAPVLLMMVATISLVATVVKVGDFLSQRSKVSQLAELPSFQINVNPVDQSLYESYARVLSRLSSQVEVTGSAKGLVIRIAKATDYPEFMYVLNSVQGISKDVVWKADEICLAKCTEGASVAIIKGVRETVSVKLKGQVS
ncbi:hypothetical protein [Limnobacter sp.]|uniref:hypothetical protein n=1 Tax=Limnobacter sp. TaxID=2003368 RepID=UPI00258ACD29|nr:hypothetical protein [Limnobacter sp.]